MKKIFTLLALIALPLMTLAQDFQFRGDGIINGIGNLINRLIPVVIAIAIFVFIIGLLKYVNAGGDEDKRTAARNTIVWGLIIIFVMFSVIGIINLLDRTFGFEKDLPAGSYPQIEIPNR